MSQDLREFDPMTTGGVVLAPGDSAKKVLANNRGRRWLPIWLWHILLLTAFFGLWQLASSRHLTKRSILPSPGDVWGAAWQMQTDGVIWPNLGATLQAVFIALFLSSVVGVVIGLGLALSPTAERVLAPYLNALNSAPRIAFAPVFIIAFGISTTAKVALAFSFVVFVMIFGARAGVHAADPDVERLMVVQGASKRQIFWKSLLPVALPSIFAALRLGLIYSILGVVTSEMIGSINGMGQLVLTYATTFQTQYLYATVFILIVVSALMNFFTALLEKRLLWWKPPAAN